MLPDDDNITDSRLLYQADRGQGGILKKQTEERGERKRERERDSKTHHVSGQRECDWSEEEQAMRDSMVGMRREEGQMT